MNHLVHHIESSTQREDCSLAISQLQDLLLEEKPFLSEQEQNYLIDLALSTLKKGNFQQQWQLAKLLPKLGAGVVPPLIEVLEDERADLDYRWFAGKILGNFIEPKVIISLTNILNSNAPEDVKELCAFTLANFGKDAVLSISKLLNNVNTRLIVTKTLAQIRCPETIEPLLSVVEDRDGQVRAIAIEALGSFRDQRILQVLLKALHDPSSQVRKEAVIALGLRKDKNLSNQIIPLLYDLNLGVCQQAAITLGKLKTPESTVALAEVLGSPHTPEPLQIQVIQALAWMETSSSLEHLDRHLRLLSEGAILETIRTLSQISDSQLREQAGKILTHFYYSPFPATKTEVIKQALAYAWGQLNTKQAKKIVQELADSQVKATQLHAQNALKNLSGVVVQ